MEQETRSLKPETRFSPLISVIVPVYNAEKTLRQCVESVLSQEFKDFELLLIDDGSKDESPIICDEYSQKDSRVKVFHQINKGVSSARNKGLSHAIGYWITFVDSDDFVSNRYFDSVLNRDEDILFTDFKARLNGLYIENPTIPTKLNTLDLSDFLLSNISSNYVRGPVMKFYKIKLLRNLFFHEDMIVSEDSCFVFDYLSRCSSAVFLPNAFYVICTHSQPQEKRYPVSVNYAINSLTHLVEAYERLNRKHNIGRDGFLPYLAFFKKASEYEWRTNKSKWYGDKRILSFYRYIWPDLSFKQKLRLIIARLLKK